MKLKTSFFNPRVFKKDVTRFAPAWGLYTLFLLMSLVTLVGNNDSAYYRTCSVVEMLVIMAWVNLIYGGVNAQLLFGDMYNSRLCNALHAMPLRREGWFFTHTAAGLTFSIVPNVLVAAVMLTMLNLGAGWSVALWWLLASTLQYLFFFGVAVLCAFLVGNRFAHAAVYTIINGMAVIVYWVAESLYRPLLNGIQFRDDTFLNWCPVYSMCDNCELISVGMEKVYDDGGYWTSTGVDRITLDDGWGYYALCAGIGVAALALALVLYRKRKLECAGDFAAFRSTEPVLLVLVTICAGGFIHAMATAFFDDSTRYLFLAVGLAVGFFGGLMLLKRTTRVFSRRAFLGFGALSAVLALSLVATWLDPIGITRYVPKQEDVASVTLGEYFSHYSYANSGGYTLTEDEDIRNMLAAHEAIISGEAEEPAPGAESIDSYWMNVSLQYTLTNGREVGRYYSINSVSETAQMLRQYYSSFAYVVGVPEDQIPAFAKRIVQITTDAVNDTESYGKVYGDMAEELLRAIAADCAAGNMVQIWAYHENGLGEDDDDSRLVHLEFGYEVDEGYISYKWFDVYESCENTLAWMEQNGLYTPADQEG